MCRTRSDGRFEVLAHAGGDAGGLRVVLRQPGRDSRELLKGADGVPAQRGYRHDACQPKSACACQALSEFGDVRGERAAPVPLGVVVEADLDVAVQRRAPGALVFGGHGLCQGRGELGPVNGVDGVGVLHDGLGLVALELPDEVPAEAKVAEFGRLVRRFLVPVFADVGDAQGGKPPDVRGGVELGDDNQLRRRVLPPGGRDGAIDALPDGGEPLPEQRSRGSGCSTIGARPIPSRSQSRPRVSPVRGAGPDQAGEPSGAGSRR